ncbi:hypothetical protein LEM8419_01426 [Neolewinella maritima]|uniref:Uncharacterized protein n=1 Tax=Neolewinella maritima TaxID=1383882 RepID=A0ABM9AZI7_9BACT|nr:hypothetical protein [Neolewinella maritima]CAH1000275.1 hypothetical protein LEM8419_01426 [Neolewinella maritima]
MRELSELIALLGPDFSIERPNDSIDPNVVDLFHLLHRPDPACGDAIAAHFELDPSSTALCALREDLQLRLLDAVTSVHRPGAADNRRDRDFSYVWKLITVAKQLRKHIASEVLLPYLEEAFRMAEDLEFVEAAYTSATMLRRQYANRRFDAEKYQYYRERAAHHQDVSRAYQDIVAVVNELFYLRNTQAAEQEIRTLALKAHRRFAPCIEAYDVTMVSYLVYLLELNVHLVDSAYPAVIEVATTALRYLAQRPRALPTMYQVFEANLAMAYAQINDYTNGMTFARRMLNKTSAGEHNYFKVYELMLILALRAGRFQTAYEIYHSMDTEVMESNMVSYYRETFRILEAYLYLLVSMEQIVPEAGDLTFQRFRIARFINSFEHASSEKSHRNVHLLIIQLVDQVIRQQHQKSALTLEAVAKYAQRYLNGKGYERLRYFLKALAQLSTQGYHRAAVERHTEKHITALKRYSLETSTLEYYMEVIPFELLWSLLLDQLGYKRIRMRRG